MRVGIVSSTKGHTETNKAVATALRADIFVWMPDCHRPTDALMYPDATHIVRLPNVQPGEGTAAYSGRVARSINDWYGEGQFADLWFQMGNEPDVAGYDLTTPWDIRVWKDVAGHYADMLRHDHSWIKILSTPFSVANTRESDAKYQLGFDGVAIHHYWPAEQGVQYGGGISWDGHSPLFFTELNSNPTDPHQLAQFLTSLTIGDGACIFMADAPDDFAEYNLSPLDAGVIRSLLDTPTPLPSSEPPAPNPVTMYSGLNNPKVYNPVTSYSLWEQYIAQTNSVDAAAIVDAYHRYCDQIIYNADLALAQAYLETGGFTSPAWRAYRNPAGIGITGENVAGPNFGAIERGVQAHLALLNCYFGDGSDPWGVLTGVGFGGFVKGFVRLNQMDGVWAVPGTGYGDSIAAIANKVVNGITQPSPLTPGRVIRLADILRVARDHIGKTQTDEGNPEYQWCEQEVEEWLEEAGLPRVRYTSAAVHGDALVSREVLRSGPWPSGAVLLFGRGFDPQGHICAGGTYPLVITTYPGQVSLIDAQANGWIDSPGFLGWYIPEGVTEDDMALPDLAPIDEGEIRLVWTTNNIVYNPQAGIYQDWRQKVYGEHLALGIPVRNEQAFDDGTRVLQPFSSGYVAQWTAGDGKVTWLGSIA